MVPMLRCLPVACVLLLAWGGAAALDGAEATREVSETPLGNRVNPTIAIEIAQPILLLQAVPTPTRTTLRVVVEHLPPGVTPTFTWAQVQEEMHPLAVRVEEAPVGWSATAGPTVEATFPKPGVYEVRVTATGAQGKVLLARNGWINVWDPASPIIVDGKPDPLAKAPGMLPPPSVRNFAPDPGPFAHPRLLSTPAEWADVHTRCLGGGSIIASRAYKRLTDSVAERMKTLRAEVALMTSLEAWAKADYRGKRPDLDQGEKDPGKVMGSFQKFTELLRDAGFIAWVRLDPAIPWAKIPDEDQILCRRLARCLGAFSRGYLAAAWKPGDRTHPKGTFATTWPGFLKHLDEPGHGFDGNQFMYQMAMAYDYLYPWMTAREAKDTRNLLIAIGPGRATGRGFPRTIAGKKENRGVGRGVQQNGTFSNFYDWQIPPAMAINGEEGEADPAVVSAFLAVPRGDADPLENPTDPYAAAMTWPHARKVDVNNLQRQIYAIQDSVSPWGMVGEQEAYFTFWSTFIWPTSVMFARAGGHNQFVTCPNYAFLNQIIYRMYPWGPGHTAQVLNGPSAYNIFNHHAGNGDHRFIHALMLKFLYPDDAAADFVAAVRAYQQENTQAPFETCLFGVDPTVKTVAGTLATMAPAKGLPLTKLDPDLGTVVLRSDWSDEALLVDFDAGFQHGGHMNAEKNSFAFFALGRSWSTQPGFHKVFGNWAATIQIQEPAWKECPYTQGYIGINPCIKPQAPGVDMPDNFPTPPGKLLEATESPDGRWSLVAGDATAAYGYVCGGPDAGRVALRRADFMYPGLLEDIRRRCPPWFEHLTESRNLYYGFLDRPVTPYPRGAVQWAIRTLLLVRGAHPFVLVVDDIRKDGTPRNYRWMMNNRLRTKPDWSGWPNEGDFSMILAPGATATDAVLLHRQDAGDELGKPRLLVRDVAPADHTQQPAMRLDQTLFDEPKTVKQDFYAKEQPNRLCIDRQAVVEPDYRILLFPHRTGEQLPITTWNDDHTVLTIRLDGDTVHRISFIGGKADHRTRLAVDLDGRASR